MNVDVVSASLDRVRLSGALLFFVEGRGTWSLAFPPGQSLLPLLAPVAKRLMFFHVVIEGSPCLRADDGQALALDAGDSILFARGDGHKIGDLASREPVAIVDLLPPLPWPNAPVVVLGQGGNRSRLLCGLVPCAATQPSPLIAALPPLVRIGGDDQLHSSLLRVQAHLIDEAQGKRPGHLGVLSRLVEAFGIEALRRYIATPAAADGAVAARHDPAIAHALRLIHAEPMRPWRVARLAREVGVSRSALAARFTEATGCPPMQYLAGQRLLITANLLQDTGGSVAAVGAAVGYGSEAGFSRAFKRHFGMPPGAWLTRHAGGVGNGAA